VLNINGEIIPGLYVTGESAASTQIPNELSPISELSWAMASGYIAGSIIGKIF